MKQTAVYVVIQFNDPKKVGAITFSSERSRRKQKRDLGMSCCSIVSEGFSFY